MLCSYQLKPLVSFVDFGCTRGLESLLGQTQAGTFILWFLAQRFAASLSSTQA